MPEIFFSVLNFARSQSGKLNAQVTSALLQSHMRVILQETPPLRTNTRALYRLRYCYLSSESPKDLISCLTEATIGLMESRACSLFTYAKNTVNESNHIADLFLDFLDDLFHVQAPADTSFYPQMMTIFVCIHCNNSCTCRLTIPVRPCLPTLLGESI